MIARFATCNFSIVKLFSVAAHAVLNFILSYLRQFFATMSTSYF